VESFSTRRVGFAFLLVSVSLAGATSGQEPTSGSGQTDLAEIGAKLSNPVSNVWALFTELDLIFSDGDENTGDPKPGGQMLLQPVLPFPLYGSGDSQWKLITRPSIPIIFSTPIPEGFNDFSHEGGLGDIQLPMLVSPPTANWLLGAGPTWLIPSATNKSLGRSQWGVGPAAVIGYKTDKIVMGVNPQYYWGFASVGDRKRASYLSMLYFLFYNLPDAWQIGFNPTVSYDNTASAGNKWNVPIGLTVAKTTKVGALPVKFQFGIEYSVVSQDDFGQRALFKVNIIPVIPSLVREPLAGGR